MMYKSNNTITTKCIFYSYFLPLAQNDPDSWVVIETNTKTTPGRS